jgi:hypothetical protein
MEVTSKDKLEVYQIIGNKLRIHWDFIEIPATEETDAHWKCKEAVVDKNSNRNQIIEAIIKSQYSVSDEFALINNGGEEYSEYQTFRTLAKQLTDEYLK